jgi:hypothetical protein
MFPHLTQVPKDFNLDSQNVISKQRVGDLSNGVPTHFIS